MANFLVTSEMVSPLTWVLKYAEEFARQKRGERRHQAEASACTKGIHEQAPCVVGLEVTRQLESRKHWGDLRETDRR